MFILQNNTENLIDMISGYNHVMILAWVEVHALCNEVDTTYGIIFPKFQMSLRFNHHHIFQKQKHLNFLFWTHCILFYLWELVSVLFIPIIDIIKWVGLSHSYICNLMRKVQGVCCQSETFFRQTWEKPRTEFVEITLIILDIYVIMQFIPILSMKFWKTRQNFYINTWLAEIRPFILFLYTKFLEIGEDTIVDRNQISFNQKNVWIFEIILFCFADIYNFSHVWWGNSHTYRGDHLKILPTRRQTKVWTGGIIIMLNHHSCSPCPNTLETGALPPSTWTEFFLVFKV